MDTDTLHAIPPGLRHLAEEGRHRLETASDRAEAMLDATMQDVQDEAHALRSRLAGLQHQAGARAQRATHAADRQLHAHPYAAVGTAAALGLLIGFLAARR